MRVFDCLDYRIFLKNYIESQPLKGRGMIAKMANHLKVHSTLMSLILSEKRQLTSEQACELIEFLDLTEEEGDYFLLLVDFDRAGTLKLKQKIQNQLKKMRESQSSVASQVKTKKVLTERQQAQFYSHWLYSGVRLFCSIGDKGQSLESICARFNISRPKALSILDFLTNAGLVILENGFYKMGVSKTYVGPGSPFLLKHHANWRLKSLQKMNDISNEELMVTSPFSVSKKDFDKLKELLLNFIKESGKVIQQTEPEELACFNLDLFWVGNHKDQV